MIGRRAGQSRDQIVVMAARDARTVPDATGSGRLHRRAPGARTRVPGPRRPEDARARVGRRRHARRPRGRSARCERLPDRGRVKAVIVLSDLGARGRGGRRPWWAGPTAPSREHRARANGGRSLREEVGAPPAAAAPSASSSGWRSRSGWGPGRAARERPPAIRFSGSGELPPRAANTRPERRRRGPPWARSAAPRSGRSPRSTPGSRSDHGPTAYVIAARKVCPGWALSLLSAALLLPPLVASIDAFARARRRREPTGAAWRWLRRASCPSAWRSCSGSSWCWSGIAPDAPAAPPAARGLPAATLAPW